MPETPPISTNQLLANWNHLTRYLNFFSFLTYFGNKKTIQLPVVENSKILISASEIKLKLFKSVDILEFQTKQKYIYTYIHGVIQPGWCLILNSGLPYLLLFFIKSNWILFWI